MTRVSTRSVTITTRDGTRLKKPKWGTVRLWQASEDITVNLRQAIAYAKKQLKVRRMGTIVYIGDIPVYHCKWSPDRSFTGWKGNPVAGLWQRKLSA